MKRNQAAISGKHTSGIALAIAIMFGLLVSPHVGRADNVRQTQGPRSITIPAGGTATITVRGFCLDFGKPFPTGQMEAKGLADEKLRAALNYAITKGYTEGNPQQTELAVWFLRDNTWHAPERTIGQEIVDNAVSAPNDAGDGTMLSEAVTQKQVSVTATFVPQTADNFYGDGEAEIKNLTNAELRVYMPVGMVFSAVGGGNFQDLMVYELGTEKVELQGTAVPLMTAQASPSVTLEPTAQPTLTAMVAAETPAPQATVAMDAPTSVAAPTGTGGPQSDLPGAGVPDSTPMLLLAAALISAVTLIGAGAVLKRRQN